MENFFRTIHPILFALLAGIFTWFLTALGSVLVFITKEFNQKIFDAMLGFAAGVMIAASFWSLLAPAIEVAGRQNPVNAWLIPTIGFLLGAVFLRIVDKLIPHLHLGFLTEESEGIKTSLHRSVLFVLAVTLHNIPEGLAVGVTIGSTSQILPQATIAGAIALTIGIGIQNIPEGFAVAISLRREKISRFKSFWFGQLSGIVEIFAAILGAGAIIWIKPLLPYALSFAAGAMIFVVVEEVIPESQRNGNFDLATTGTIIGFLIMMILDVALG
uniref:ZIP family metal transporter n=1 Tax=candidate division WOR-3 bacterium TaxID=2052148 RepID=A0A7C6A936_UNCW3